MKLHPVHMMVIHFPAALIPMDLLFQGVGLFFNIEALVQASYYCLIAGVVGGWIAIITGLADLFLFTADTEQGIKAATIHGALQSMIIIVFSVVLSVEYHHSVYVTHPPVYFLIIKFVMVLLMFAGNYLGGEVLFRFVANKFQDRNNRD